MDAQTPLDRAAFEAVHSYHGVLLGRGTGRTTLLTYLARRAKTHRDHPYLTAVDAQGDTVTVTFGELDALTARTAAWIRRDLEAKHGEVVGMLPVNDLPSVLAVFGALRAGCAVLFLNPADPVARLRELTGARKTAHVLRSPAVPEDTYPGAVAVPGTAVEESGGAPVPDPELDLADDALYFGTSGSTAASKLVAQSHGNLVANAEGVGHHHRLRPGDTFLGCLPIHHVNGLHFTVFATLVNGAHAVLAHGFDPLGYPQLVERFRPRVASVVPTVLEALAEMWRSPALPSEFGYFVSAAAPLTADTTRAVTRRLGTRVLQGYGLTETTNFSTTLPADESEESYRRLMLDTDIPSVGVAVPGNEVAVLAPDGRHLPLGEQGELCMRGHNVMNRYAGNAAATDEAFRHGWFHSGDLGVRMRDEHSDRDYFVITGRAKNIAKVSGEAVSLDEMDRALRVLPGVRDAACVSVPDRFTGDEILAAVVLDGDAGDLDVREGLREHFAEAALPRRVVRMDALPRTATGKIRRPELAERLTERRD